MQQVLCLEKNNNNNNNINDKWAGLVSKIEKHLVCSCLLLSDALIDALAAYYVRLLKKEIKKQPQSECEVYPGDLSLLLTSSVTVQCSLFK